MVMVRQNDPGCAGSPEGLEHGMQFLLKPKKALIGVENVTVFVTGAGDDSEFTWRFRMGRAVPREAALAPLGHGMRCCIGVSLR